MLTILNPSHSHSKTKMDQVVKMNSYEQTFLWFVNCAQKNISNRIINSTACWIKSQLKVTTREDLQCHRTKTKRTKSTKTCKSLKDKYEWSSRIWRTQLIRKLCQLLLVIKLLTRRNFATTSLHRFKLSLKRISLIEKQQLNQPLCIASSLSSQWWWSITL